MKHGVVNCVNNDLRDGFDDSGVRVIAGDGVLALMRGVGGRKVFDSEPKLGRRRLTFIFRRNEGVTIAIAVLSAVELVVPDPCIRGGRGRSGRA